MAVVLAHGGHLDSSPGVAGAGLRGVVLLAAVALAAWLLHRGRFLLGAVASVVPALLVVAPNVAGIVLAGHRAAVTLWLAAAVVWLRPPRTRPVALVAAAAATLTAVTGATLAWSERVRLDALPFDRLVLLKALLLVVAVVLAVRRWHAVEVGVLLVTASVGSALVLLPVAPPPGRPLSTLAGGMELSVVPQRPGLNWVRVVSDRDVTVDGVRATEQPGTTGKWARVRLPAGRSSLDVLATGRPWESRVRAEVVVDTGHGADAGVQDPECSSAWTGAALVGRAPASCPSQHLEASDAKALEALVDWLARRGVKGVTVLGDGTPRSDQATAVLERARARNGLTRVGALVVTSGWSGATRQLTGRRPPVEGVYLAPWLASGPLLADLATLGPLVVLPFDPAGQAARDYTARLSGTETPSSAGYLAWGGAASAPRVYATAPIAILPKDLGHGHTRRTWFPGGALTDVSGRLGVG